MRMLVVEDEVKIAKSLERGLMAEGYVVDLAFDGDSAETLANVNSYDLILLDWMLPGQYDGPGLVRLWRERGEQAPILMLTARTTIGDRVSGLDVGADDYLSKPFSFDELLARIRALLRRPKAHGNNILKTNDFSLDVVAKTVTFKGKLVHMTTKEFHVLEYLMRHKGQVISKDRLLDHVWSDDDRVQYNTVETFIANVRRKLGSDAAVETVRGYGYKVE